MLRYKEFPNYDAYVKKQGGKITYKLNDILAACPERIKGFEKIFQSLIKYFHPGNMLCLGARTGCEVQASENVGFSSAIGVDLHPVGPKVIQGDWHNLPFPDNGFHNAFTNSIDHCMNLDKLVAEVYRVLATDGRILIMSMLKQAFSRVEEDIPTRMAVRAYDAMFWDTEQDYVQPFLKYGFSKMIEKADSKWFYTILKKEPRFEA